eukprot:scaffold321603_cov25-Prasinocladus_malaysianus.AAC.1
MTAQPGSCEAKKRNDAVCCPRQDFRVDSVLNGQSGFPHRCWKRFCTCSAASTGTRRGEPAQTAGAGRTDCFLFSLTIGTRT